jgi:hypothetical protein
MQRKKYSITTDQYRIFKNQYLINLIRNSDEPDRYGQAFLNYFPKIVEEYIVIGGDRGEEEAAMIWNEKDIVKVEKLIGHWIV